VGISSGANLLAAIKVARQREDGKAIATVFADSNVRYLSTDLARTEPLRDGFITPDVELLRMQVVKGS
nr:hypothetical protein [Erythrobacter sp.]